MTHDGIVSQESYTLAGEEHDIMNGTVHIRNIDNLK